MGPLTPSPSWLVQQVRLTETKLIIFLSAPVPPCGLALHVPLTLGDTPSVLVINATLCFLFTLLNLAQIGFYYLQPEVFVCNPQSSDLAILSQGLKWPLQLSDTTHFSEWISTLFLAALLGG